MESSPMNMHTDEVVCAHNVWPADDAPCNLIFADAERITFIDDVIVAVPEMRVDTPSPSKAREKPAGAKKSASPSPPPAPVAVTAVMEATVSASACAMDVDGDDEGSMAEEDTNLLDGADYAGDASSDTSGNGAASKKRKRAKKRANGAVGGGGDDGDDDDEASEEGAVYVHETGKLKKYMDMLATYAVEYILEHDKKEMSDEQKKELLRDKCAEARKLSSAFAKHPWMKSAAREDNDVDEEDGQDAGKEGEVNAPEKGADETDEDDEHLQDAVDKMIQLLFPTHLIDSRYFVTDEEANEKADKSHLRALHYDEDVQRDEHDEAAERAIKQRRAEHVAKQKENATEGTDAALDDYEEDSFVQDHSDDESGSAKATAATDAAAAQAKAAAAQAKAAAVVASVDQQSHLTKSAASRLDFLKKKSSAENSHVSAERSEKDEGEKCRITGVKLSKKKGERTDAPVTAAQRSRSRKKVQPQPPSPVSAEPAKKDVNEKRALIEKPQYVHRCLLPPDAVREIEEPLRDVTDPALRDMALLELNRALLVMISVDNPQFNDSHMKAGRDETETVLAAYEKKNSLSALTTACRAKPTLLDRKPDAAPNVRGARILDVAYTTVAMGKRSAYERAFRAANVPPNALATRLLNSRFAEVRGELYTLSDDDVRLLQKYAPEQMHCAVSGETLRAGDRVHCMVFPSVLVYTRTLMEQTLYEQFAARVLCDARSGRVLGRTDFATAYSAARTSAPDLYSATLCFVRADEAEKPMHGMDAIMRRRRAQQMMQPQARAATPASSAAEKLARIASASRFEAKAMSAADDGDEQLELENGEAAAVAAVVPTKTVAKRKRSAPKKADVDKVDEEHDVGDDEHDDSPNNGTETRKKDGKVKQDVRKKARTAELRAQHPTLEYATEMRDMYVKKWKDYLEELKLLDAQISKSQADVDNDDDDVHLEDALLDRVPGLTTKNVRDKIAECEAELKSLNESLDKKRVSLAAFEDDVEMFSKLSTSVDKMASECAEKKQLIEDLKKYEQRVHDEHNKRVLLLKQKRREVDDLRKENEVERQSWITVHNECEEEAKKAAAAAASVAAPVVPKSSARKRKAPEAPAAAAEDDDKPHANGHVHAEDADAEAARAELDEEDDAANGDAAAAPAAAEETAPPPAKKLTWREAALNKRPPVTVNIDSNAVRGYKVTWEHALQSDARVRYWLTRAVENNPFHVHNVTEEVNLLGAGYELYFCSAETVHLLHVATEHVFHAQQFGYATKTPSSPTLDMLMFAKDSSHRDDAKSKMPLYTSNLEKVVLEKLKLHANAAKESKETWLDTVNEREEKLKDQDDTFWPLADNHSTTARSLSESVRRIKCDTNALDEHLYDETLLSVWFTIIALSFFHPTETSKENNEVEYLPTLAAYDKKRCETVPATYEPTLHDVVRKDKWNLVAKPDIAFYLMVNHLPFGRHLSSNERMLYLVRVVLEAVYKLLVLPRAHFLFFYGALAKIDGKVPKVPREIETRVLGASFEIDDDLLAQYENYLHKTFSSACFDFQDSMKWFYKKKADDDVECSVDRRLDAMQLRIDCDLVLSAVVARLKRESLYSKRTYEATYELNEHRRYQQRAVPLQYMVKCETAAWRYVREELRDTVHNDAHALDNLSSVETLYFLNRLFPLHY